MDRHILTNQMITARGEGHLEGKAEGRAEGRAEGMAEGRKEGRKEGMAEGRKEGRTEMVIKMAQHGMPAEQIAEITGEPLEEIRKAITSQ